MRVQMMLSEFLVGAWRVPPMITENLVFFEISILFDRWTWKRKRARLDDVVDDHLGEQRVQVGGVGKFAGGQFFVQSASHLFHVG